MTAAKQSARRPGLTAFELLVVIAILLLALAFLVPAVQKVRGAAGRVQSQNNLKQLALACHAFHDTYKGLPPTVGKVGQAEGSLHYHILPFIEQAALYNQSNNAVWNNDTWSVVIPIYVDGRDESAPPGNVFRGWLATTNYPANWMVFKEGKTSL